MNYLKRPYRIKAIQYTGDNLEEVIAFDIGLRPYEYAFTKGVDRRTLTWKTGKNSESIVEVGNWLVIDGFEKHVYNTKLFDMHYMPAASIYKITSEGFNKEIETLNDIHERIYAEVAD